jgi:hypothetical protein
VTAPLADDAATARAVLARYAGCAGHWMSARASG